MYRTYNSRPLPRPITKRRSRKPLAAAALLVLLIVSSYISYALLRPAPEVNLTIAPPVTPALVRVNIPWPTAAPSEQSAFGADGYGLLAQSGLGGATAETITPLPMASVAKIVTGLAVLEKKPLKTGEQGPAITITDADVAIYNQYVAQDGSVVPIRAGATITEYQALQALLLPSANNIADTLANWAFGDLKTYNTYASAYVKKLGMKNTTITDASGLAATTTSTAADLIKLGDTALGNPVLADIFNQKTADFPEYGPIQNANKLLGQSGIRGIKTGNTDEAGGVFLGAADVLIGSRDITVITAVMGAPDLAQALRGTLPLIQSAPAQFQIVRIVRAGQIVGKATSAWGSSVDIMANKEIAVTAWTGTSVSPNSTTKIVHAPIEKRSTVGNLSLKFNGRTQNSELKLTDTIKEPGIFWRLQHPF